jgi:hypothetical protein
VKIKQATEEKQDGRHSLHFKPEDRGFNNLRNVRELPIQEDIHIHIHDCEITNFMEMNSS